MNEIQKAKEKTCTFFASDYHFEMISLPYIEKELEENSKIIILTENNLEETMKVLISRTNLEENKKKKVLEINWSSNNLNKFKEIKESIKKEKNIILFIKGKQNYINNINKNIENWIENYKKLKVIDCYDMEEINDKILDITENYTNILNTNGEKEIQKL